MNSSYCLDIRSQASRAVAAGDLDEVRRIADLMAPGPGRDLLLKRAGLVKPKKHAPYRKAHQRREQILMIVTSNPGVRRVEICETLGLAPDGVAKYLAQLHTENVAFPVNGRWYPGVGPE